MTQKSKPSNNKSTAKIDCSAIGKYTDSQTFCLNFLGFSQLFPLKNQILCCFSLAWFKERDNQSINQPIKEMGSGSVKNAASKEEVEKAVNEGVPVILHFWATWCDASKHMDQVFSHLSTDFPHVHFFRVFPFFN